MVEHSPCKREVLRPRLAAHFSRPATMAPNVGPWHNQFSKESTRGFVGTREVEYVFQLGRGERNGTERKRA
ncbi:hypothetical protein DPMN_000331 [Dreissena polymorpha]|uniref:Uncharacterized protein n=1 Tax=Dreissena polymorpha TaxID=45954 RepID=A0A9D4MF65_DREPO|nr:hypothetical protein DPMN_000331 [Dreissena polymorpha]